jgi:hypothetical protein
VLRDEPAHFSHVFACCSPAARPEGIGADRLSDFLNLEHGSEFALLGQAELGPSALGDAVRDDQITRQYYGRPPLLDTRLLPDAERPRRRYLDWHRDKIFVV